MEENALVKDRIRLLCEALLQEEGFSAARAHFNKFREDEVARANYDEMNRLLENLRIQKKTSGLGASPEQKAEVDAAAQGVFSRPSSRDLRVARLYLQEFSEHLERVLVSMLETGEVPDLEEKWEPVRLGKH